MKYGKYGSINYIFTKEKGSDVFGGWFSKVDCSDPQIRSNILQSSETKNTISRLLQNKGLNTNIIFVHGNPGDGKR